MSIGVAGLLCGYNSIPVFPKAPMQFGNHASDQLLRPVRDQAVKGRIHQIRKMWSVSVSKVEPQIYLCTTKIEARHHFRKEMAKLKVYSGCHNALDTALHPPRFFLIVNLVGRDLDIERKQGKRTRGGEERWRQRGRWWRRKGAGRQPHNCKCVSEERYFHSDILRPSHVSPRSLTLSTVLNRNTVL